MKTIYGTQTTVSSPLLSASGSTLITDKAEIVHRWATHFDSVPSCPSHINEDVIAQLPQMKMNMSLDDPHTVAEVEKAIAALSSGKVPGSDAIPAELYKLSRSVSYLKISGVHQESRRNLRLPLLFTSTRERVTVSAATTSLAFFFSLAGKILAPESSTGAP